MPPFSQYHVFALPAHILDALTPRNLISQTPPRTPSPIVDQSPATTGPAGRTCNVCLGATFVDVEQQRNHFRSDWHRYNVKIRLSQGKSTTEAEFNQLVESLEDSLSGSASSSEEDDSDDSDAVRALVKKHQPLERNPSPTADPVRNAPRTALVWFHSPPSTQIGVYRSLFSLTAPETSYVPQLSEMQKGGEEGRTWALFMVAGGHFAGAIVRVQKPDIDQEDVDGGKSKKGKQKKPKPDVEVLKHKTFHRYTTRRKQGGEQSMNDKSKGAAISAGAMLRRYGQTALQEDIRGLLTDWAEDLLDCDRIWLRANTSNRRIFMDYEGAVIPKGDDRLRTFPFPTRRPTQAELTRCLFELTQVKVSHFTEEELRAQDEAYIASLPKPRPQPTPSVPHPPKAEKEKPPQLTQEEELLRDKWRRALEMINKGRVESFKVFWEREGPALGGIDASVPDWAGERGGTLLQVAASANQEEATRFLLEDLHADPTIDVPAGVEKESDDLDQGQQSDSSDAPQKRISGSRRTAYDLARTLEIRNVFRRCAAVHPDQWDWFGAARVPSALTKEMEEERDEKKKVKRKGLKDKVRERQAKEREKEKEVQPAVEVKDVKPRIPRDLSGPQKLGGSAGASEGVAGLTPEMRAKVERERRARAAEARMKALGR
ncbi:hypothetical protein JAAARDRAFT_54947 [Jaapia argillacea MUCL 33604]|uniref:VLRF1 domain-containing protein n=1 Tax=Jaapia argillacea MUCL 33604 TaxID=933084 RepID=A0A067Q5Z2_9AGAM|nr:hypothetical protein JAAARDRAFT_54947 [Jaapia argillacea MUCL 33604]